MQDNNYKNQLLIVNQNLVGIKDRGTINNNAVVSGTAITFHPMVRDNWGTSDPLRGVLGSYYTRYRSSKGEALYDYSNALRAISNGYIPQDFDHGPGGIGPLRDQLVGSGPAGTNIVFPFSFYSTADDQIQLLGNTVAWDGYSIASNQEGNGSQWFLDNFEEYVFGSLKTPASQLLTIEDIVNENTVVYQGLLNDQNIENKAFSDHTSMHFLLSSDRSLRERSGVLTGVEPVYNYYVNSNPDYEDVIADPRVEEYLIPNAYYLQLELQNTASFPLAPYHVLAVQFGQQPIVVANTPEGPRPWFNISHQGATENNIGSYYDLYSDGMSARISTLDQSAKNTLQAVNGDIAILHSDIGVLAPDSIETVNIPFFNKITIGQDTEGLSNSTSFLGDILSNPDTSNFVDMLQAFAVYALSYDGTTPLPAAQFSTRYKILNNVNNLNDYVFESDDIAFPILFDLGDHAFIGYGEFGLVSRDNAVFYQNKSPGGIDPRLLRM